VPLKQNKTFLYRVPKISVNVGGVAADTLYTMCGPAFSPRSDLSALVEKLLRGLKLERIH
jgi:hypothetical protein